MASSIDKLLPAEKGYHFNVIYNQAKSKMSKTEDTKMSLELTELVVEKLSGWGYKKSFYADRDALAGKNVFQQILKAIDQSCFTIVIFTNGFLANCWLQYCNTTAFKKLLSNGGDSPNQLFFILFGVNDKQIPSHLCLNNYISLTRSDWNTEAGKPEWNKLKSMLIDPLSRSGNNTELTEKETQNGLLSSKTQNSAEKKTMPYVMPSKKTGISNSLKPKESSLKTPEKPQSQVFPVEMNGKENNARTNHCHTNGPEAESKQTPAEILKQTDCKMNSGLASPPVSVAMVHKSAGQIEASKIQLDYGPSICSPQEDKNYGSFEQAFSTLNKSGHETSQQSFEAVIHEQKANHNLKILEENVKLVTSNNASVEPSKKPYKKAKTWSLEEDSIVPNTSICTISEPVENHCFEEHNSNAAEDDILSSLPTVVLNDNLGAVKNSRSLSLSNLNQERQASYKQALFKVLCHNVYSSVQPYI